MKKVRIKTKESFVPRTFEEAQLQAIGKSGEASIIIMYGRRRIGKTELLEQTFKNRNLLKFEGIEGLSEHEQFALVMSQLAAYAEEPLLKKTVIGSWREFFEILARYTTKGTWTIYLEELQWLANYNSTLVSELKYVWDNHFRHNPKLILILCGSAPTFMVENVVRSKALYNRSQYEFRLREFSLIEAKEFLKKRSDKEILDAYLTIGGIPEYLKWVNKESSVFLSLCKHSFTANSFFSHEYERIFTSGMARNKHYQTIIDILAQRKSATRTELMKELDISSGGSLTSILDDLEKSGFVVNYYPFNLSEGTMLSRYAIADNYLQFYFKFIKPLAQDIDGGVYNKNPRAALNTDSYIKWLGFAFERFCRSHHHVIARILQFSGIRYRSGSFFSRATEKTSAGFQIDLIFDRSDNVYTICEIKYLHGKVGTSVIEEFEKKLALFPNKENKTIHKVLICSEGADQALMNSGYFDEIITRDNLFDSRNW